MKITIRMMEPKEAMAVWKLGIRTFHSMEGIFMGKPKLAVVALDGEKIVGAAMLKKYSYKGGLLGYIDYGFVDVKYHGQGIGYQLYARAVKELREAGCKEVCAIVRGDNPGSFMLCEKLGMHRCDLLEVKKVLGVGILKAITLSSPLGIGSSGDFYISSVTERRDSNQQILRYVFVNVLLLLFGVFAHREKLLYSMLAAITVMLVTVACGSSIRLFGKSNYRFRLSIGGYYISAVLAAIGSFFPMLGKWYPEKFRPSKEQTKELCIGAVAEWIGLFGLYFIAYYLLRNTLYGRYLGNFSAAMLMYHLLPTFPFNEYGPRRIYNFSKILYALFLIGTVVILFLI